MPNSPPSPGTASSATPAAAPPLPPPLLLKIRGVGNIAGFKNRKRAVRGGLITEPKMKARMQALQRAIECELRAASPTSDGGTSMAARRQFLTRSLPQDDCWTVIPELVVTGELVAPGEEGCDIEITRLPSP